MRLLMRRLALRPGTAATRATLRRALFTYDLPAERIASHPADPRGSSKLLVYRNTHLEDATFSDLDGYLPEGALVVANDSRVVRARLACSTDGAPFEVLLLAPADATADPAALVAAGADGQAWAAMARTTNIGEGSILKVEGSEAHLRVSRVVSPWVEHGEDDGTEVEIVVEAAGTLADLLDVCGEVPVPPYLGRSVEASDDEDYQTTYASEQGSVAAPTAGLHFTGEHWARVQNNFETARVTLHVGAGTFRPVTGSIDEHDMHAERFSVTRATVEALIAAKRDGRSIVAVGTTSCRALESLYLLAVKIASITPCAMKGQELRKRAVLGDLGALPQWSGRGDRPDVVQTFESLLQTSPADTFAASTSLCITNDGRWRFSVVDALVTNFHHPDSTLLHLVDAFLAGKARDLYRRALAGDYRFLSYGDACYLTRSMDEHAAAAVEPRTERVAGLGAEEQCAAAAPNETERPKVLLHSCCAPCSGAMIEEMVEKQDADVTIFFYNPNIHPRAEYELRKRENEEYARRLGVPFVDGDYDPDEWYKRARGMEFSPERGSRCTMCFDMRMDRTALYAHEWGFSHIATTNSTSRWKDEQQVDDSGRRAAAKYDLTYMDDDWKTDVMTARKYEINAQQSFYKQEYCGCSFSLRDNNFHRAKEGLDPIKPAQGDVYSDPLADAAEESPEVVDAFFRDAPAFSEELRGVYKTRRRARDASVSGNNW
ncbi:unnamed protein product [Pelagomonas calceolata]|uniref:Epoxyqueuosine reductase n=1 Tax=Pelagomonas calceolata TaxID=35677 RepID=A0A7S4A803_9STRA|nr:unnamed protein product [Pelagomonas calceolata]|mmetsp:Transcript_19760/g.51714  ORF Transcript_19760/g.51714 Transcript_19760/m.51714 type:complete len:716 (+) Transcript_19760:98-2245(+)